MSLKCTINGAGCQLKAIKNLTEQGLKVKTIEEHDEEIRADERKKFIEWLEWLERKIENPYIKLDEYKEALIEKYPELVEEIRADERRKFAEWFKKSDYYLCYSDTIDEVIAEYEKEQNNV